MGTAYCLTAWRSYDLIIAKSTGVFDRHITKAMLTCNSNQQLRPPTFHWWWEASKNHLETSLQKLLADQIAGMDRQGYIGREMTE